MWQHVAVLSSTSRSFFEIPSYVIFGRHRKAPKSSTPLAAHPLELPSSAKASDSPGSLPSWQMTSGDANTNSALSERIEQGISVFWIISHILLDLWIWMRLENLEWLWHVETSGESKWYQCLFERSRFPSSHRSTWKLWSCPLKIIQQEISDPTKPTSCHNMAV